MPNGARPSPAIVQARLREIDRRYRKRRRRSPAQLASLRLNDLGKLFRARYGAEQLPDDDAGREDMAVALNHLATLAHPKGRIEQWLKLWAPWLTIAERDAMTVEAIMNQRHWTADQLAWRLGLTMADRTALGITTIGACDMSKADRTKLRKVKHRERQRARRIRLKSACAP